MASKILDWALFGSSGTNLNGGGAVDTGGITVTMAFNDQDTGASATIADTPQYTASGEPYDDSSLSLYGNGGEGGVDPTSTTTLSFSSTDSAYADEVRNVAFRINDLDRGNDNDDHIDIVTVTAFDAGGNPVDVAFTPAGNQTVDGNTVTGTDQDNGDISPDDQEGSVLVDIAGPVAEIRVAYANGEDTDQRIWLTDMHFETMDPSDPDGYVEGTDGDDEIDLAYTGDPDGDMIDAGDEVLPGEGPDDDIVLAFDGDDTVRSGEGDDEVYAGGGSDSVEGGVGNDVIYGDSDLEGVGGNGEATRESFNWSDLGDPDTMDPNNPIDDGDDLDGMTLTQNTGNVTVTAAIESRSESNLVSEFDDNDIYVDGIDGGSETVNDESSLRSYDGDGDGDATYTFTFSEPVTNAQFTVADIDANRGQVSVRAYDAADNPIPVTLTAGDDLNLSDNDSVSGDETATGTDNGSADDEDNAMLVDIAGPVARIEVDHVNVGSGGTAVNISDIFFDTAGEDFGGGAPGADTLSGGEGDDAIYGEGGDDLIDGGAGGDAIEGGTGNDTISGDAPVTPVSITIDGGSAGFENELFAYTIDPDTGTISNVQTLSPNAKADVGQTFSYDAAPGAEVGVGIVSPEGTFYSSGYGGNVGLNSDGLVHTQGVAQGPDGQVTLGFEDRAGLGDGDFNDVTVTVDLGTSGASLDNAHYSYTSSTPESTDDGHDLISGGDGDDLIHGLGGNDTVPGGDGDDVVYAGSGDDSITGGAGADTLSGGDDRDTFTGATAGDHIDGGSGGVDYDTLDLTGSAPAGGSLSVAYTPGTGNEDGVVSFFDGDGLLTGSATFEEIENVIPCFTPGTAIATPKGERLVEELQVGDRVITRDNGLQEIRWIGTKPLSGVEMARLPHLKPVLIKRGALGNGLPERDTMVSPNHRVLINSDRSALFFEEREVLAAAKHLVGTEGIHEVDVLNTSYIHFMFDHHEVVLSNGAWTESFQPGDLSLKGVGDEQRGEILELFPELASETGIRDYRAARRSLKKHEAKLLVK